MHLKHKTIKEYITRLIFAEPFQVFQVGIYMYYVVYYTVSTKWASGLAENLVY